MPDRDEHTLVLVAEIERLRAALLEIAEHPHIGHGEPTYGDPPREPHEVVDLADGYMRFFQLGANVGHGHAADIAKAALK